MSIYKAQGQSLDAVGVSLELSGFSNWNFAIFKMNLMFLRDLWLIFVFSFDQIE